LWDRKNHQALLVAFAPPNLRLLGALVTFRQLVGDFPLTPSVRRSRILSEGEEAFEQAVRPSLGPDPDNIAASAWTTYDLIQKQSFLDADTMATRLAFPANAATDADSGSETKRDALSTEKVWNEFA